MAFCPRTDRLCRDAVQHSYNAWVREFGTGNKEHQQIIAQCEAFLNANGYSRFAPFPYDPQSLPIRDMAGYRASGSHDDDPIVFYTFPATFETEIASGFNPKQFARVLVESGMMTPPTTDHRPPAEVTSVSYQGLTSGSTTSM